MTIAAARRPGATPLVQSKPTSARTFASHFLRAASIALSLAIFCATAPALDRDRTISQLYHTSWTAKDGAPSQVSALTQTTDGFLWIGSAVGLFRFDGVKFEPYAPPADVKLPSYNIYALMATPDNGLWISFRPSGLGFLKDGRLKLFTKPEELPPSQVYCFAQTADGRVWAGTHDGLAFYNGTGWTMIGADWNLNPERIRTLYVDKDDTLWISTDHRVASLVAGSTRFESSTPREQLVLRFAQPPQRGRPWAAAYTDSDPSGPLRFDKNPDQRSYTTSVTTHEILFDRDGALWMNNEDRGLARIAYPERLFGNYVSTTTPEPDRYTDHDGLSGNSLFNLFEDREGNIWVATLNGIDRFRNSPVKPLKLQTDFRRLTLLSAGNGKIWAASSLTGLIMRIGEDVEVKIPFTINPISSGFRDGRETFWWGSNSVLLRQTGSELQRFAPPPGLKPDFMWEIFRIGDEGLWVNFGDDGLIYFDDGKWERRRPPDGLPNRGPSATFVDDRNGRTWLGYTENRIFTIENGTAKGYTKDDGLEIGRTKVIRGRGTTEIWAGGELGLAFLREGRFHTVAAEGNQFGAVSGIILTDNGDVWLNELHGIVRIPATEVAQLALNPEHRVHYRLFDFTDNLPGGPQMNFTVSTAIADDSGKLWFATDAGLARIDPDAIGTNKLAPPVVIKSLVADDHMFANSPGLKFPAGTGNIRIDYTALSLSIPERVQFKYRLVGVDDRWQEVGNRREAYYNNLGPGTYRFQVIASNNDNVWNEEGASTEFEILPKFYQTFWFSALCIAALAIAGWLAYHWRVYAVESRMNRQFDERLAERTRIAQDLHDTLLQSIVGVSMQLDVAVDRIPDGLQAKSRLIRIRELMASIIDEGRNTVRGLRSTRGDGRTRSLENEVMKFGQQLNADGGVDYQLTVTGIPAAMDEAAYDDTIRICREAVANAFRHAGADSIRVNVEYSDVGMLITIGDDGAGIEPKILEHGREGHWGLSGMRQRAAAIGAKLTISSSPGSGTTVELVIPATIAFELDTAAERATGIKAIFRRLKKVR